MVNASRGPVRSALHDCASNPPQMASGVAKHSGCAWANGGHRQRPKAAVAALAPPEDFCYRCEPFACNNPHSVTDRPMQPTDREHRVIEALHRIAVFCDTRIGWNRLGIALSAVILAVAGAVLYRILRTIDVREVVDALASTDWRDFMLAAVYVTCGYFPLTFYDLFALRTIGRGDVPYWAAALAGFSSYAVGHNVGASVFTGGAVRYRIYSGWGLSVIEVTKICFVAGLTFWLGNAAMLGLGVLYSPQQASDIDQL